MSLRLADVLGPYDDSSRFWKYFLWAKVAASGENTNGKFDLQLNTGDHINSKLSFTLSSDVVRILMQQATSDQKIYGNFNIACPEAATLKEFLLLAFPEASNRFKMMDHKKGEGHARAFYPSVDCGFINVSRAG